MADRRLRLGFSTIKLIAGAAILPALTGCEVLTSDLASTLADDAGSRSGIAYALPRSVMDFTLAVDKDNARFSVTPSAPRSIADPYHKYFLRYQPLPNYDDNISVTVTGQGFLKTVSTNTTDRTGDIILNLVKSVSAFGQPFEAATSPPSEQQLARITIDPANPDEVAETVCAFNEIVQRYAHKIASACKSDYGKVPPPTTGKEEFDRKFKDLSLNITQKSRCEEYRGLATGNHVSISFKRLGEETAWPGAALECKHALKDASLPASPTPVPTTEPYREPDCSVGICYRPPQPFEMEIAVGGSRSKGVVLLPNLSPTVAIDIRRSFFINKVQTLEFDADGSLKAMGVQKQSELLALSSFPVQVVSAVADSLRLRVQVLDQQIGDANATNDLLQAKADLERQKVLFESAEYQILGRRSTATSYSAVPATLPPTATAQSASTGSFLNSAKPITNEQ